MTKSFKGLKNKLEGRMWAALWPCLYYMYYRLSNRLLPIEYPKLILELINFDAF